MRAKRSSARITSPERLSERLLCNGQHFQLTTMRSRVRHCLRVPVESPWISAAKTYHVELVLTETTVSVGDTSFKMPQLMGRSNLLKSRLRGQFDNGSWCLIRLPYTSHRCPAQSIPARNSLASSQPSLSQTVRLRLPLSGRPPRSSFLPTA